MSLGPKVVYEFGPFRLDPDKQILLRGDEPVAITPKAIDTLLVLIRNSRQVVSKDELLRSVWPDAFVEESNLSQNIFIVRKALGDTPEDRRYILTLPGRGYRFVADVHTVTQEGDDVVIRGHSRSKVIIEQADRSSGAWPATANEGGNSRIESERSSERRSDPGIDRKRWRRASKVAAILVLVSVLLLVITVWRRPSKDSMIGKDESPLVLMPLLALPGEERMPALALDGGRIAFLRHAPLPKDSGIWTEVIGSQSLLQLSHNPNDSHPAWSPDGRFVAFLRNTGDEFAIALIASLGGEERRLHTGRQTPFETPTSLSFSADGRQLAFSEWDEATQQSSIKLISIFDGSIRTLTSPPLSYHDAAPAFSPDGKSIAFVRSTGPILVDDIFVVPAKGGEARQITFDRRRLFSAPAWINGGQELMFSSTRAGMKALWRVPARGGAAKLVSGSGPQTDNPSVSSSRGELAYEYSIEEENLWRLDVEGRTLAKAAATALLAPKTSNLMPHFSPDGRKIAFESDRSGYEEIWICDADGTNPAQVTRLERYSGSPRWSPDGR